MSDIVIKAENLGKKYTIGHQAENGRYVVLRDVLMQNARGLWHKTKDLAQGKPIIQGDTLEEVWALKDVSFEIQRGEAVGIIGRNGAGKSTLLKILSRITEPSAGRVTIEGRVASLLEVGTGFHPELTGRENVYLNGAILGMVRSEIKRKFDEIVSFAEVERFLDTPVKRYSSGMYVRLAFAVAAHLEPEILLVDEVLAVGDAAFQKKCLGKMGDVAREGRTVLFVSHNLSSVRQLCRRGILLKHGVTAFVGPVENALDAYLDNQGSRTSLPATLGYRQVDKENSLQGQQAELTKVSLYDSVGGLRASFKMNEDILIEIRFQILELLHNFHLYARVFSSEGVLAFASADWDHDQVETNLYEHGSYAACLTIPRSLLNAGRFYVSLDGLIPSIRYIFRQEHAIEWEVVAVGGAGGVESINRKGIFRPLLRWSIHDENRDISVLSP